jgi:hypothetical protein
MMHTPRTLIIGKIRQLVLLVVFSLACQPNTTIAIADVTDMITDFLEGEVQIIDFNSTVTKFRIVENGAVVDVRNDIHIRLVDDPYNLPMKFTIIAPMTAVDIISGKIPPSYIHKYPLKHYLLLQEKYHKQATKTPFAARSERIINKQDADHIFTLDRVGWEKYAQRIVYPAGWKMRLAPHDTGTSVMAFDPNTGTGLSIQPLYYGNDLPPGRLIVGSYYPLGSLRPFDDEVKRSIEKAAASDLGPDYSVSATYSKLSPFKLEGIELMVTKK